MRNDKMSKAFDPIIAVTGVTGTLGQAVAAALRSTGWRVEGCSFHGSRSGGVPAVDVRDEFLVRTWLASLAAKAGLKALVTCAGVAAVRPALEQSVPDFLRVLSTNVTGTWLCAREAAGLGCERIVTVSSVLGGWPLGYPDRAAYIASKAAVAGLTRALAVEFAPRGVAVNCVAPGHFSLMASKASGLLEGALAKSPTGRLVTPEEVAEVVAWLAVGAPLQLTGAVIPIDGAYTLSQYPLPRWWGEMEGGGS